MKNNYVKRTQKDYPMSFKLDVVREIEQGELTRSQAKSKEKPIKRKTLHKPWFVQSFNIFNPSINCDGYLGLVNIYSKNYFPSISNSLHTTSVV